MTHDNMMKDFVKVYCRLKRDSRSRRELYRIQKYFDFEEITFHHQVCHKNKPFHRFKFHKIFDISSTQEDIYNTIAKPVVDRVLEGYNGTIFAYGQTGSGKTYTITGSPRKYDERGIIPRAIQEVFSIVNQSKDNFSVKISYLEIYNEIGYDLLNPQYTVSCLEELPRVTFLEDGKGEAHIRNLSVQSVYTEQEAMKLLYLGDTNRTITETPMNEFSSRSHCIFTIYITARNGPDGKSRKSKLHLVDLAGSERVYKSKISGVTLNEAKYINLSLHYLEQVILALSQTRRLHVPYRNSMMTLMLKDSLSGNTVTVMLATMATNERNILETLSTCKFAQRVAMITTEAVVNVEIDPRQEVEQLKNEVEELKRQIEMLTKPKLKSGLTALDKTECEQLIRSFIASSERVPLTTDIDDSSKVEYCFQLLKNEIVTQRSETESRESAYSLHQKYQQILNQKDNEISALTMMLKSLQHMHSNATLTRYYPDGAQNLTRAEQEAFDLFLINYPKKDDINFYFNTLETRYKAAQGEVESIENCQREILEIKGCLDSINDAGSYESRIMLSQKLICLQSLYKSGLANLQMIKKDIDYLKQGLQQTQLKVIQSFKDWYYKDERMVKEGGDNILINTSPREHFGSGLFQSNNGSSDVLYKMQTFNTMENKSVHSIVNPLKPQYSNCAPHNAPKDICKPFTCDLVVAREISLPKSPETPINESSLLQSIGNSLNKENSDTLNLDHLLNQIDHVKETNQRPETDASLNSFLSSTNRSNETPSASQDSSSINTTEEKSFNDFMKRIPLTGDSEVDEEIIQFYRNKFRR